MFRHKDSLSAAAVLYVRCIRGDNESEMVTFGFNTMLTDNTYVMTSGNKRLLNKPSTFRCEFLPGRAPKDVFERHRERSIISRRIPARSSPTTTWLASYSTAKMRRRNSIWSAASS